MLNLIVAHSANFVIGYKNSLPWYIPEDLSHFKKITLGSTVVMGRATYDSIGKPLPHRRNIVLTRNRNLELPNVETDLKFYEILKMAETEEVFIIGGSNIYEQYLPFVNKIYLTYVDTIIEGDAFFPPLHTDTWKMISSKKGKKCEDIKVDYYFCEIERIKKTK